MFSSWCGVFKRIDRTLLPWPSSVIAKHPWTRKFSVISNHLSWCCFVPQNWMAPPLWRAFQNWDRIVHNNLDKLIIEVLAQNEEMNWTYKDIFCTRDENEFQAWQLKHDQRSPLLLKLHFFGAQAHVIAWLASLWTLLSQGGRELEPRYSLSDPPLAGYNQDLRKPFHQLCSTEKAQNWPLNPRWSLCQGCCGHLTEISFASCQNQASLQPVPQQQHVHGYVSRFKSMLGKIYCIFQPNWCTSF